MRYRTLLLAAVGVCAKNTPLDESPDGRQDVEHRIEDRPRLLGIAVGEQLHGALEVREEDGDLFALALKRRFGRQDLLGEVLGRVGLRGGEPRLPGGSPLTERIATGSVTRTVVPWPGSL